ncbi:hypothetical protein UlMin_007459 [Ulmus minor]
MASLLAFTFFISTLFSTSLYSIDGASIKNITKTKPTKRTEKLSHLHFFFHDIVGGENATAVRIISGPTNASTPSYFGSTWMMDDVLTEGKEPTSKIVGRAQGFYSVATKYEFALLMVVNFAFVDGKYNGSSLSILGRNPVLNDVREMPIVGGSGLFRFARGYALAHTVWFDTHTGDATVEYNVYVLHY